MPTADVFRPRLPLDPFDDAQPPWHADPAAQPAAPHTVLVLGAAAHADLAPLALSPHLASSLLLIATHTRRPSPPPPSAPSSSSACPRRSTSTTQAQCGSSGCSTVRSASHTRGTPRRMRSPASSSSQSSAPAASLPSPSPPSLRSR
ncbi:hypothetical protein H2248_012548 [Termitomyces sp. 'cryptogamus']|nr:hypothetical protein H2248_012548 [Termitomyces sp. 'cryptogamus']